MSSITIYTAPKLNKTTRRYEVHKLVDNTITETFASETESGANFMFNALTIDLTEDQSRNLGKKDPVELRGKSLVAYRENVVLKYRLLGFPPEDIYVMVTGGGADGFDDSLRWKISLKTIKKYYYDCIKRVFNEPEQEKADILAEGKARWKTIMQKAALKEDLTNVREAAKQLDKINGLDQLNVNVKIKRDKVTDMSDEELAEALIEINEENQNRDGN